jgi:hypothetical protein
MRSIHPPPVLDLTYIDWAGSTRDASAKCKVWTAADGLPSPAR